MKKPVLLKRPTKIRFRNHCLTKYRLSLIKNESKKIIDELELDLQNQTLTRKNIDIRTRLDQVLKVLPNLSQLYTTGDSENKKTIICLIFAEN